MRYAPSTWLLHGVHFLLALSLPLVLIFVMGCKKASETGVDFGPPVDGKVIDQALVNAIQGASTDGVTYGQSVEYSIVRRLESEEVTMLLGTTRVEVIDRKVVGSDNVFTVEIVRRNRINNAGDFDERKTSDTIAVPIKPQLSALVGGSPLHALMATEAVPQEATHTGTTFHRLSEWATTEAPPSKVGGKTDCGGLSPCAVPLRFVRFDMVRWFSDGSYQQITFDLAFSSHTPWLPYGEDFDIFNGLLVRDCRSTYIPIEDRTVYVRDCQVLEDLNKTGKPEPTQP